MKKSFVVVFLLIAIFAFSACGGGSNNNGNETVETTEAQTEAQTEAPTSTEPEQEPVVLNMFFDALDAGVEWVGVPGQDGVTAEGGTDGNPLIASVPNSGNSVWLDLREYNLVLTADTIADVTLSYDVSGGNFTAWLVGSTDDPHHWPFNEVFDGATIWHIVDNAEGSADVKFRNGSGWSERPLTNDYHVLGIIFQIWGGERTVNRFTFGL